MTRDEKDSFALPSGAEELALCHLNRFWVARLTEMGDRGPEQKTSAIEIAKPMRVVTIHQSLPSIFLHLLIIIVSMSTGESGELPVSGVM